MLDNYEINYDTVAVIPLDENISKVMEENATYIVDKNATEIVNHSCKYFGSSLEGRKEGTKALMGVSYKAPIIIEESRGLIFFPTSSPRFNTCNWISLNHICDYIRKKEGTQINFKNGEFLNLNISYGSLENQVLRATRLESILRHRKI